MTRRTLLRNLLSSMLAVPMLGAYERTLSHAMIEPEDERHINPQITQIICVICGWILFRHRDCHGLWLDVVLRHFTSQRPLGTRRTQFLARLLARRHNLGKKIPAITITMKYEQAVVRCPACIQRLGLKYRFITPVTDVLNHEHRRFGADASDLGIAPRQRSAFNVEIKRNRNANRASRILRVYTHHQQQTQQTPQRHHTQNFFHDYSFPQIKNDGLHETYLKLACHWVGPAVIATRNRGDEAFFL